jgi:site-specific DNA-methyltransferase (adenine-specific)
MPALSGGDLVLDTTCGTGRWLQAIPSHVPAYGVEIDPELANIARESTGRMVIEADVLQVELPHRPTAVVGNPPFSVRLIEGLLDRCHAWLNPGERAAMILPAYFFQTAERVACYLRAWGVETEIIPRNLFHGLSKPLVFAVFERGGTEALGLALFGEAADVQAMRRQYRRMLESAGQSAWKRVVIEAAISAGGTISLAQLYRDLLAALAGPSHRLVRLASETP